MHYRLLTRRLLPLPRPVLAVVLLAPAGLLMTGGAAANSLVLRDTVYVQGPNVTVADVAEIEGEFAQTVANVELGRAARPGFSTRIDAALVESRLRSSGVDTDEVVIEGARSVEAKTLHLEVTPEMLAESLRRHIRDEMPWDPAFADIRVPLARSTVTVPEGDLEIAWRANPDYNYVGAEGFKGTISVNGEVERTLLMRAEVDAYGDVVVAVDDIQRGHPVSPRRVAVEKRRLSRMPRNAILNKDEVIGLVARKTLFAGEVFTSRDVEEPTVVHRNQLVPVELTTGNLHLQARARATMDGRVGDIIVCENPKSEQRFQGIVRADGVVVVQ